MRDSADPLPRRAPANDGILLRADALEAVIRVLAGSLTQSDIWGASTGNHVDPKPLLALEETAELLGVSRMTVARMADEGRIPSVVVRRGRVQKTRRIPRAFVDRMVADACAGAQVDIEAYAATWLAEHDHSLGPAGGD